MKKEVKIILYCALAVILIVVFCLILWQSKNEAWEPDEATASEELTVTDNTEAPNVQQPTQDFEQDVMNDLESFFNDNNGYENIQWDFWFINSEN